MKNIQPINNKNISENAMTKTQQISNYDNVQAVTGQLFENLDEEWLTHEEAAKYLRLSSGALRNMVCSGVVSCYKLGHRNRYSKAELRNLLKRKGDFAWV